LFHGHSDTSRLFAVKQCLDMNFKKSKKLLHQIKKMILDSLLLLQYLFLDFFDYFYHLFGMMQYSWENEIFIFPEN